MNANAFGLANAAVYGVFMAVLAWLGMAFPGARRAVDLTAAYYPGYRATMAGSLVGALWGVTSGFAIGWVTAWLYNRLRALPTGPEYEPAVPAGTRLERGAGI